MKIQQSLYQEIISCFSPAPPEAGGIIGMKDGTICAFCFDEGIPNLDRASYIPDVEQLNEIIEQWQREGIRFCGIVHSHPFGQDSLSSGDLDYIQRILHAVPQQIDSLYFPVVVFEEGFYAFSAALEDGAVCINPENVQLV